jgi:Fic family protein
MESPSVKAQRLLNALYERELRRSEPIPEGYMDAIGWGKEFKITRQNAKKRLERLFKAGLLKKVLIKRWTKSGYKNIAHYGE